jgi:hypothetical protein
MEDLINTIRNRYRHVSNYRNLSTLVLRKPPSPTHEEPSQETYKKKSFFDIFSPKVSDVSRKLHNEIRVLLDRREKAVLQTVTREANNLVTQHARKWSSDFAKNDKARLDFMGRTDKKVDLYIADTTGKLQYVQKELDKLKTAEKSRQSATSNKLSGDVQLSHRTAKRLVLDSALHERAEMRREFDEKAKNTQRSIIRKLRDEEEYKRRRGG